MVLLLWRIGVDEVADRLAIRNASAAAAIVALVLGQLALGAVRLRIVCSALGVQDPGERTALAWIGMGAALNQVLPSSIGGDGYRILALGRRAGLGAATRTIIAERVLGLLTLSALTLPLSLAAMPLAESRLAFGVSMAIAAAVLVGGAVADVLTRALARWTASRIVEMAAQDIAAMYSKSTLLPVFGASAAIHALSIATLAAVGAALALDEVLWWQAALVVPGMLLISAIPISLGGWGVRESSVVFALSAFGISHASALALSIGYGLAMAGAGVLGLLLWVICGGERRA
jgi:hypothetical protein